MCRKFLISEKSGEALFCKIQCRTWLRRPLNWEFANLISFQCQKYPIVSESSVLLNAISIQKQLAHLERICWMNFLALKCMPSEHPAVFVWCMLNWTLENIWLCIVQWNAKFCAALGVSCDGEIMCGTQTAQKSEQVQNALPCCFFRTEIVRLCAEHKILSKCSMRSLVASSELR